jgi:CDP-diacylglycerol--glycerol-3-phosphate 3-phosphatidyltransferase
MEKPHRDPSKWYPHDYLMRYTFIPLLPACVTPNMMTGLRFFLIPFVLYFLYMGNYDVGIPLFLFAAFTDALDGSLARVRKKITDWGTLYDPIADKLLISTVVLLIVVKHINIIFGLLIVMIESIIVFVGYLRKNSGTVLPANVFGKTKMVLQVVGVSLLLIAVWAGIDLFIPLSIGTLSLAIVFAVISLFTYSL